VSSEFGDKACTRRNMICSACGSEHVGNRCEQYQTEPRLILGDDMSRYCAVVIVIVIEARLEIYLTAAAIGTDAIA